MGASYESNQKSNYTTASSLYKDARAIFKKNVERTFEILQNCFAIIKGPARGWDMEDLLYIMMTCIILYNMIIEDQSEEEEEVMIDSNEIKTRPRAAEIYESYKEDHEVELNAPALEEFMSRYQEVRCPVVYNYLQKDLVKHLWNVKLQAERNRR
jgi:hypothetical protein